MRKGRLIFWFITAVICVILVLIQKNEESKITYEEKTEMKVYCLEEFRDKVKDIIEESSIGNDHRVVFTDNKAEAEFILTDRITVSDGDYKKIGWTPLVVVFDNISDGKVEAYEKAGYLTKVESGSSYIIDFEKVIDDTLKGKFEDKIYCPKSNTREGELFFDFLLININNGRYPKNESEMEECSQIANEFLNSDIVNELSSTERLKNTMSVVNEMYITFEKDIYDMQTTSYEFEISYPTNTVVYEYYYYIQGNNKIELEEIVNEHKFGEYDNRIQNLMYKNYIRYSGHMKAYTMNYHEESNGFSYVEIPFKEE